MMGRNFKKAVRAIDDAARALKRARDNAPEDGDIQQMTKKVGLFWR